MTSARVAVVAGKGGVGKTTLTAALARAAARTGASVLVVGLDDRPGLGELLGGPGLSYQPVELGSTRAGHGTIRGRALDAETALMDHLADRGMRRVAKRFLATGAVEVLATTTPGIRDLLLLGKIRQLEQAGVADLILVDAPAAGHAITFLRAPRALRDTVAVGPVHHQAVQALEMLHDPARCQVLLATLPEETPVNEVIEVAYSLEDKVGVQLGPVLVNGCWPAPDDTEPPAHIGEADRRRLSDAAATVGARHDRQSTQRQRLASGLPLPQVAVPFRFTARLGPADVDALADALAAPVAA